MVYDCCSKKNRLKKCLRKDGKLFNLHRKFTRKQCNKVRGFTMKSSCAPYKFCSDYNKDNKKNNFLYNPDNPEKSFDVYIDKNPDDTINIKYKTLTDVKNTINYLEKLYKNNKYSHKRIWQVGMIMYVRLKVLEKKKPKEYKLAYKYFKFLGKRTKLNDKERKKLTFIF